VRRSKVWYHIDSIDSIVVFQEDSIDSIFVFQMRGKCRSCSSATTYLYGRIFIELGFSAVVEYDIVLGGLCSLLGASSLKLPWANLKKYRLAKLAQGTALLHYFRRMVPEFGTWGRL
jgi:hypothetical protein